METGSPLYFPASVFDTPDDVELNFPSSVFVSPSNNEVYIADISNHVIRKILQNGNIETIAGNGKQGYSGDNGPATSAQLKYPSSVFVSFNNEVYIADKGNHAIRKILRNGNIETIAGNGKQGYSGDNGPATNALLFCPKSVFVSPSNEVYIADESNNRIRKILETGNIVTIAGNGQKGFSGDNGPATNAQLYYPSSVFVSASNNEVYIADTSNHRIRKILRNGSIETIAGNGKSGYSGDNGPATSAQLKYPFSVFVTQNDDEVYIADCENHAIRKILLNGNIVTIAGSRQGGYSGDNGPATSAQLKYPSSVFVSFNNEVYIADKGNHAIRKILRNGNIETIAGNGKQGYSGDNGPATNALLFCPKSVFVSPSNEVYIADESNNRIRKILETGNIVTIAGNGQKGFSGDNGPATNAQLYYPSSVFVSASNNEVYIADTSNHRIRKILRNGSIETIAGNGKSGYSGDNGPATSAQLKYPFSVFVTQNDDEVYIADCENHAIRKILLNGNIVTIAGSRQGGYSGDNGPATSAQLKYPFSVFVTQNDEVYIADQHNHAIRKILRNGSIETIAGNGKPGYSGDSIFDFSLHPHIGGYLNANRTIEHHFKKKFGTLLLYDCNFQYKNNK